MKMSKLFVQTMREFPSDAEVMSHKLLVRAGFIRKLASGIYNYLPLMQRVLKKIEKIVREEMDNSGAQELLMPFVQPEELWQESGRWEVYGKELMRLKDRHNRQMCLGPTHEEVITFIAREGIKSYKQLPVNLYQIQSKFRDEIRPRFGLLRGREFIMKDAYSFDVDEKGLDISYEVMAKAYTRIFERCGLETRMVQSDSGAIGGSVSHEFMVLCNTDAGENDVFYCEKCGYSANSNHAVSKLPETLINEIVPNFEKVQTPDAKTIDEVANFLKLSKNSICKALVYIADKNPVMALVRGDKAVEETKLKNAIGANEIRIASSVEIRELFNADAGFIGPIDCPEMKIVADITVQDLKHFVCGANQADAHFVGASLDKITKNIQFADIRLVEAGEICPQCPETLKITKGIEVGNIFKLGTKYSKTMNATFVDENDALIPFVMGCYGIGISRTAAAAVERHHDEWGIKWPSAIAPYHVVVVPVNVGDELQMSTAVEIYNELLSKNVEVVLDDRDERAGVKFKDADLIGFPYRITVGKTISEGLVELKIRETGEVRIISRQEVISEISSQVL